MASPSQIPHRQIRAHYDGEFITVYQAYKDSIAGAAVQSQKLNASPEFKPGRMTWIKPSWCWIMYRAGYSYKDPGQNRILALKMRREHFVGLLERGVLSTHPASNGHRDEDRTNRNNRERPSDVRVQWDPERTARLDVLPYRSIQIGIPGALSAIWANEWIASIEDVTDGARELKKTLDEQPGMTTEELIERGLLPIERPFPVSETILSRLEMTIPGR